MTAPDAIRDRLVELSTPARIEVCARMRPGAPTEVGEATKRSLRCLARRHEALSVEIAELDAAIHELCVAENPALLGACGVGPEVAAALLIAAGTTPNGCATRHHSQRCADRVQSKHHRAKPPGTASTAAGTATRTTPCGGS